MSKQIRRTALVLSFVCLVAFAAAEAAAQRGGNARVRSSASSSMQGAGSGRSTANANRANAANVNANRNVNASGANVNRNVNASSVNVNRNVNVNVDYDNNVGWGGYGHPVARGAAVAVTTAAVMGAYYAALPTGCVTVPRGALTYHQCGSVWYQPVYSGANVQYVVVPAP